MERDFLGLNSKIVSMALKEEFEDTSKNTGMQWSFSNKVSAVPQLLSFKAAQDEKQRKITVDPLGPYSSVIQKNVASDKKPANQYAMTAYRFQNAEPVVRSSVNLQPLGGVPIPTAISVPLTSSVVGTTELRNASMPPGSMAQLTIFYAGSVCVYNDISPEKAQAIMLLAGSNGLPQTQNNMLSTGQVKASFPCSNIELPAAAAAAAKPIHSKPPMDASSAALIASIAPTFVPAAVPQARKASLVRFLEKRKERIHTCPYSIAKKPSDCSSTTLDLMA
ncbi:protein TIFY 6B-like isoform X1 [Cucurbita pepo subsp. pepo]|uniref:protein TIFY 6B-like isoform X1 n=1 Tax=Cucurbita pepo subsp. pepo TaxID=3664 RepID=UPI000C9D6543|nr:protein TIFY 6B-like isoform X1 [Cucurbita pepo subsp. pepo]